GEKQIILNTIRCGWDHDTEVAWRQIASLGHGQYSTIQQDGGVQQVATPYDEKIAETSARIDSTTVIVGDDAAREDYRRKIDAAKAAPAAAKADRARYYTGKGGGRADGDLVGGYDSGTMSVEATPSAALPEDL